VPNTDAAADDADDAVAAAPADSGVLAKQLYPHAAAAVWPAHLAHLRLYCWRSLRELQQRSAASARHGRMATIRPLPPRPWPTPAVGLCQMTTQSAQLQLFAS